MIPTLDVDGVIAAQLPLDCTPPALTRAIARLGCYGPGRRLPRHLRARALQAAMRRADQVWHRWEIVSTDGHLWVRVRRGVPDAGIVIVAGGERRPPDIRGRPLPTCSWVDLARRGVIPGFLHTKRPPLPELPVRPRRPADLPRCAGRVVPDARPANLPPIALRIHQLRVTRGWSLSELGRRSGIPQPGLSQIERGRAQPRLDTLGKLASVYGIRLRDLVDPD